MEIVLENGKQVFDKKLLHVILGGKNMKDRESQREFVILHCSAASVLAKIFSPQRGNARGLPRSNKRETNRPSFFRN